MSLIYCIRKNEKDIVSWMKIEKTRKNLPTKTAKTARRMYGPHQENPKLHNCDSVDKAERNSYTFSKYADKDKKWLKKQRVLASPTP